MYTKHDAGCWADGALGYDHVRAVMANELERNYKDYLPLGDGRGMYWPQIAPIVAQLREPMSDDNWECDEAIEWLDKACSHNCYWNIIDGDLLLIVVDENEVE